MSLIVGLPAVLSSHATPPCTISTTATISVRVTCRTDAPESGRLPKPSGMRRRLHLAWRALRRAAASLVGQILAVVVLAIVVPLAVTLPQGRADQLAAEQRAFGQAQAAAHAGATDVGDTIDKARRAAQVLSHVPAFWGASDADRDRLLEAFASTDATLNSLIYFTADFRERGTSTRVPDGSRRDMSIRPYAQEAVRTGQVAASDAAVVARSNGLRITSIVIPLQEANRPDHAGFLSTTLLVDQVPSSWEDVSLPPGSDLLLVDLRAGRILSGTGDAASHINDLVDAASLEHVRAGEPFFRARAPDGAERLRAWAPVAGTPWVVMADIPSAAVLEPIFVQTRQRARIAVAVAVVVVALLLLLGRRLSTRLRALQSAAVHWSQQEWQYRAGLRGTDELSHLGGTFDRMADHLQASIGQLEEALGRAQAGQARIRAVTDSAADGIVGVDRGGRAVFVNPAAAALLGYTVDELIGQPLHELIHHTDVDGTPLALRDCVAATTFREGEPDCCGS